MLSNPQSVLALIQLNRSAGLSRLLLKSKSLLLHSLTKIFVIFSIHYLTSLTSPSSKSLTHLLVNQGAEALSGI